jgi:hypothetical protein
VVALVALAAAAAALYVVLAPDRYVATADLALSPITDDELYRGLPVLRGTDADDRRPVETVARLAGSGAVADRVVRRLRLDSRDDALDAIDVEALPDANAVAIHAEASDPARAAQLANGFADEVVSQRHLQFQSAVVTALTRVREQLTQVPASRRNDPEYLPLSRRVTELRTLEGTGDPTIELSSAAVAPDSAERPSVGLIPAAAGGALVLGLLALALARPRAAAAPAPASDPQQTERLERALARLEAVEPPAPGPAPSAPPPAPDTELEQREALLEKRVGAVAERERELARPSAEVAERERKLDRTAKQLDTRDREVVERAAELDERERELDEHKAAAVPPAASEPSVPLEPEPVPAGGAYNVEVLERLVGERGGEQPQRLDEWNHYLVSLREHAGVDGTLPKSFDALVDDVFGELLEARR